MKKVLLAALLTLFSLSPQLFAAICIKLWLYGHTEQGTWVYRWTDQWDGYNYWCIGEGNDCGLYDWMAVYYCSVVGNDPSPGINTSDYGNRLVHDQADAEGIALPSNLGLPSFSLSWLP